MARLTNAQLVQQLEAAHIAYDKLAAKYDSLLAERAERQAARPAIADHLVRRAAMQTAKAEAMATGRVVKVGG